MTVHAATLVTFAPDGLPSAPYRGAAEPHVLHARLAEPAELSGAQGTADARDQGASPPGAGESRESPPAQAKADPRSGVPGGADLPLPDKWYTATELDVRAEPLSEVPLDYPEELEGSGIPGRVQLALFIDERGVVRRMHIVEAEPARLFDKAAMRAWVDVRFSPARKGGVAVKSRKLLELTFRP